MNNISVKFPIILKIFGVLRFSLIKLLLGKKFKNNGFYVVEKGTLIHSKKKGEISIGRKAHFFSFVEIQSRGRLIIGDYFSINRFSRVIAFDHITIGNNVTIAQFVTILDHDHKYVLESNELKFEGYVTNKITIGNNVWIGDKVTVLKGTTIGDNVIIGANSIVNKNIPNNSIAVGNPIKIIKTIED